MSSLEFYTVHSINKYLLCISYTINAEPNELLSALKELTAQRKEYRQEAGQLQGQTPLLRDTRRRNTETKPGLPTIWPAPITSSLLSL